MLLSHNYERHELCVTAKDRIPHGRFLLLQNLHFHHPWWSDADVEPPRMGSRRGFGGDAQFMSRCQCMRLKPLFITDMNRKHLAETRREPIRGGSTSASMRLTVSARCFRSISPGIICGTVVMEP